VKFRHQADDELDVKTISSLIREHLIACPLQKIAKIFACLGITVCVGSSCGILGSKKSTSTTLGQNNGACLDHLGPIANQFLDGSIDPGTWGATFDCVDNTIDLFSKYVQGSDANGYLATDLQFLMQKFIFSRGTVTPAFIDGTLSIKASLFGGTSARLSKAEVENFRSLARFLKTETTALIPHLHNRKVNPTPDNLRALSGAIETFGNHLAAYLNTTANPELTTEKMVEFMTELTKLSFTTDSATVEAWTRLGMEVKVLLVKGAADGVAGPDWTKIIQYGSSAAGAAVAYFNAPDGNSAFQIEMVTKLQSVLNQSVTAWGGALPFSELEKITGLAPYSILPELADDFKNGVKATLHPRSVTANGKTTTYRPALARILQTKSDTGIDAAAIQRLVDAFSQGTRSSDELSTIYSGLKEDLLPADFTTLAKTYLAGKTAAVQADVNRLITIAGRYPGLYPADSPEIQFLDQSKHSMNNLNRMSWYEIGATLLMQSYGSSSDSIGKAATVDDLQFLIDDLAPFLYSIHMQNPLKTGAGAARFLEANLFMPTGNGDTLMNLPETAEYLAFIMSGSHQEARIKSEAMVTCPQQGWDVPLKLPRYDINCFRANLKTNFASIFENMPLLRDEVATMSPADRATWDQTLELAAKGSGYNQVPITQYDLSSYAGLPHYAESVMLRFDTNHDGALDRSEVLNNAFPVFKQELSTLSGIKIDFVNKAVLLYLMQKGQKPAILDLLGWALGFEFLKDFQARRIRVYQIFAVLGKPAAVDPSSDTPPPGIYPPPAATNSLVGNGLLAKTLNNLVLGLTPVVTQSTVAVAPPPAANPPFDLSTVDPVQLKGYAPGPTIDPSSPYQQALDVLPQDL
jgi:hypothetical protein